MGAYHGRGGFETLSHRRAVLAKPDPSLMYPPAHRQRAEDHAKAVVITVHVDRARCSGIGMCDTFADVVFKVGDDGLAEVIDETPPESGRSAIEEAVSSCSTGAQSVENRSRSATAFVITQDCCTDASCIPVCSVGCIRTVAGDAHRCFT